MYLVTSSKSMILIAGGFLIFMAGEIRNHISDKDGLQVPHSIGADDNHDASSSAVTMDVNKMLETVRRIMDAKQRLLTTKQLLVRASLGGLNRTWVDEHTIRTGGKPLRHIIVSTWRSGSSFLGELVSSHPGTIYFFEPLMFLESERARSPDRIHKMREIVDQMSHCRFNVREWLDKDATFMSFLLKRQAPLEDACTKVENSTNFCTDPNFVSQICQEFPIHVSKFVRMQLKDANFLVEDDRFETKVLYLARDPRGTLKSRDVSNYWCAKHQDCSNARILCQDLKEDFMVGQELKKANPNHFMSMRYEDLATNVEGSARKIFEFFQLEFHPEVQKFIKSHTSLPSSQFDKFEFGTFRNSAVTAFEWIDYFQNKTEVLGHIENVCGEAMRLWGYQKQLSNSNKS